MLSRTCFWLHCSSTILLVAAVHIPPRCGVGSYLSPHNRCARYLVVRQHGLLLFIGSAVNSISMRTSACSCFAMVARMAITASRNIIRLGRELCCDDLVVRRPSSRESVTVCENLIQMTK